jgi:hypothetical protein
MSLLPRGQQVAGVWVSVDSPYLPLDLPKGSRRDRKHCLSRLEPCGVCLVQVWPGQESGWGSAVLKPLLPLPGGEACSACGQG